jgi:hypothetical protein
MNFQDRLIEVLLEAKYAGNVRDRESRRAYAYSKAAAAQGSRAKARAAQGHGAMSTRWSETEIAQAYAEGKPVPSRGSQSNAPEAEVKAARKRRDKVHSQINLGPKRAGKYDASIFGLGKKRKWEK